MKQQFISYQKLSKKAKKQEDAKKRGSWGGMSPVTRMPPPPKAYNRSKEKQRYLCRGEE